MDDTRPARSGAFHLVRQMGKISRKNRWGEFDQNREPDPAKGDSLAEILARAGRTLLPGRRRFYTVVGEVTSASTSTGNFTERAIKHKLWASLWSSSALSR